MRTPACILALALFTPVTALAADGKRSEPRRARIGGLGFMQVGTHIGPIADIAGTLRDPNALGGRATSPEFGYTIGGGGRRFCCVAWSSEAEGLVCSRRGWAAIEGLRG